MIRKKIQFDDYIDEKIISIVLSTKRNMVYCKNCSSILKFDYEDIDNKYPPHIRCCVCESRIQLDRRYYNIRKVRISNRGLTSVVFEDSGGYSCTLRDSSSVEPRIWIGKDKVPVKLFLPDIDQTKKGWIDYPLPEQVKLFGEMELNQNQVKALLPYLEYFVKYGFLPVDNNNSINDIQEDK